VDRVPPVIRLTIRGLTTTVEVVPDCEDSWESVRNLVRMGLRVEVEALS
jgi:hypothetical protein